MNSFFHKLRSLIFRSQKDDDLGEELRFHLEEEAEELEAKGLTADEARLAARRSIGNVTQVQEETRRAWTWPVVEQLVQDCRYGFRTLAANKTFSLMAILSLALGIGANTAIYSFMDALLLRSLPVSDPASLVVFNWHAKTRTRDFVMKTMSGSTWGDGEGGQVSGILPFPLYEEFLAKSDTVFSSVFAYYPTRKVNLMVHGQAEQTGGEYVSGDYFSGLAVSPAVGRTIIRDDDRLGAPAVAVLSHAYSRKRFGDPSTALGQTIYINNVPFQVAGVAPPGFFGIDPSSTPDFYVPLRTAFLLQNLPWNEFGKRYQEKNYYWIEIMARLRPGVSLNQAQAALGPMFHQWVEATASNDRERATLPTLYLREGAAGLETLRRQYSKPLYVLLAIVALILTIACANIANLQLARSAARRREMAVRLSMGAGRFRLVRQLLTESIILATAGGVAGVFLAMWGIQFLTQLLANGREDFTLRPDLNWHVLGVAFGLSIFTGILFGLAPALQSTRVDVIPALKETRAGQASLRHSLRFGSASHLLVVAQIAISLLLLVGSGLFLRTLAKLQSVELGFNQSNLLTFRLNARQAGHRDPEILSYFGELRKQFAAIPGVISASASHSPLIGEGTWAGPVVPVGKERQGSTHILMTTSEFFSTMQVPIVSGRTFDDRDRAGSAPVAIVSEAYVKKNFGDQNPLGQYVSVHRRLPNLPQDVQIVGVARNLRYGALKGEFREIAYLPYDQGSYYPVDAMTFALRTSGEPLRYVNAVREIVRRADSRVPVTDINTLSGQIDQAMNQEIIFARLCTAFAALALLIACVGLYGTMAYSVARRTSEIGIRMALGAQRGDVIWMVLRQVLVLACAGLAIGVPTALGISRFVESFLFDVQPNDGAAFTPAVLILTAAAMLAGYVPARNASRIDPMKAVRHE